MRHRPAIRPTRSPRRGSTLRAAALACAVLLAACIGGTGTDTDNGVTEVKGPLHDFKGTAARVVDAEGRPIAGVTLVLHTPGYRPDSGAAEALVLDPSKPLVSDSQGYVRFELAAPGKFVAEGRMGDTTLFFDTLAVADVKSLAAYTFRARPRTAVKGRVRLASGLRVVSGAVFLRGTARWSPLDSAGAYDLGSLPVDFAALAVGLAYRSGLGEVRVAEQRVPASGPAVIDTARPVYSCREVSGDSAARAVTPASGSAPSATPSTDTARLDSARQAAVQRSCDSLAAGTVVAVKAPSQTSLNEAKRDSVTTPYLAVKPETAGGANYGGTKSVDGAVLLVPLAGCVPAPGSSETTYDLALRPASGGSDLLVSDVADSCLAR